jgi:hypothetical protein
MDLILPNDIGVNGKAFVALSDLHDILLDTTSLKTRNKVFKEIYEKEVIVGTQDIIDKYEKKKKEKETINF